MDSRAIGVFDSGLGGLTSVRELRKLLPNERIVFLGDTLRVPYGSRDRQTIRDFAEDDFRFLVSRDVKHIIIACGTVSSNLSAEELAAVPVPVTGVITPAAIAAASASSNGIIGVIDNEPPHGRVVGEIIAELVDGVKKPSGASEPVVVDAKPNGLV